MEQLTNINRIVFDAKQNYLEERLLAKKPMNITKPEEKKELNSETDLKRVVNEANKYVVGLNTQFSIETHEGTNRTIVKMIDMTTDEVIKEFPPEAMLDVVAGIWEQAGILVDRME